VGQLSLLLLIFALECVISITVKEGAL